MTRSAHFQAVLDHLGFRRMQEKEQEQSLNLSAFVDGCN